MPEGVRVEVVDGLATIDFVDKRLRGPAIARLLDIGGPATLETLTHSGPRFLYRVPEGNAREAGLLDESAPIELPDTSSGGNTTGASQPDVPTSANAFAVELHTGTFTGGRDGAGEAEPPHAPPADPQGYDDDPDSVPGKGYDDGLPDGDWSRGDLNAYAVDVLEIADAPKMRNKEVVLAAIHAELEKRKAAPPAD